MTVCVLEDLAPPEIKKWIVLRETTYIGYDSETRYYIDSFFTDQRVFPKTSLYKIIKHRLDYSSGGKSPKNPFSEVLCEAVLERLYSGNLRLSLSCLRNVLENSPPGDFKSSVDESVIQKYLNKNSINTFLDLNVLPNLYSKEFNSTFLPLAIDILALNRHIQWTSQLFGAVNTAIQLRADQTKIIKKENEIRIRRDDYNFAVEKLIRNELVILDQKKEKMTQTQKGALLADYVTRSHYRKIFENQTKKIYDDHYFWKLAKANIDHHGIAMNMVQWEKPI